MKEEDGGGEEVGEDMEGRREVEQEDKDEGREEEQDERVLGQAPGVSTME